MREAVLPTSAFLRALGLVVVWGEKGQEGGRALGRSVALKVGEKPRGASCTQRQRQRQLWPQAGSRRSLEARLLAHPREALQELWPLSLCQLCNLAWRVCCVCSCPGDWLRDSLSRLLIIPLSPAWLLVQPACPWRKARPSDTLLACPSIPGTFICPCGCICSVQSPCPACHLMLSFPGCSLHCSTHFLRGARLAPSMQAVPSQEAFK